jgi:HTH-type transcriptional regulator, sugar sensing transcriptional regulator
MTKEKVQNLLADVGFSGLEASVYVALLREPNATGYRVAQLVGKPAANTYKALDSLRVKGAIVADETAGTRTYAALSIHEYLDGQRRNLETSQARIEEALKDVAVTPMHGGIFELTSPEQIYERCRNLIRAATSVVLVDAFPHAFEKIRSELVAAIKRGVKVYVKTYSPTKLAGCDLLTPEHDVELLKAWNGEWLNVFVDCGEFVQSLLKKGDAGVHEAVWSRNPYLAFLAYGGFIHELFLTRLGEMIHQDKTHKEMIQEMRRLSKRYMETSCMFKSIPENWTTRWWKDRLQELETTAAEAKSGN